MRAQINSRSPLIKFCGRSSGLRKIPQLNSAMHRFRKLWPNYLVLSIIVTVGCGASTHRGALRSVAKVPATLLSSCPCKTYPITAATSKSGPPLTAAQRKWISRILRSATFHQQIPYLRFAIISLPKEHVPLVVYVNTPTARRYGFYGGAVIGASCNTVFDPQVHGVFAGPVCGPPLPTPTPF